VINPRQVVPTLILEDGTAIGDVPAIMRYLDEPSGNASARHHAQGQGADRNVGAAAPSWRASQAVMEGVRNKVAGLKGRAIAGPHDYEQISALVERSVLRVEKLLRRPERAAGADALRRRRALFGRGHHRPGDGGLCQRAAAPAIGRTRCSQALVQDCVQPS